LKLQGRADCRHAEDAVAVIEAPCRSDLLIELVRKLKPQVVVAGVAHLEVITNAAFVNLLSATEDVGSRLFLDISSGLPSTNGVLKYLDGNTLPSHATILCGLVKNQVPITYHIKFFPLRNQYK
jgi:methionine S-methyltransferase